MISGKHDHYCPDHNIWFECMNKTECTIEDEPNAVRSQIVTQMCPQAGNIKYPHSKFKTIQEEVLIWQRHNFPGRSPWMPLVGLGEELGELAGAESKAEVNDAIADCGIYLADYCNGMGYNLNSFYLTDGADRATVSFSKALIYYGKLCHSHLKQVQRIRMHEDHKGEAVKAIKSILHFLSSFCETPLDELTYSIWQSVRQRDWQKDPNTSHVQKGDGQ